jgi:hypothetical protein
VSPGGDIMIHGMPNGWGWAWPALQMFSWTAGCIALRDQDMDEVWAAVDVGTPIEIRLEISQNIDTRWRRCRPLEMLSSRVGGARSVCALPRVICYFEMALVTIKVFCQPRAAARQG